MKKLLSTIVKAMSISLCITALVIPQALQQYTKTIENGQEKWTLNKQYLSAFDEEEPQRQQIDPQNFFHQKQIESANNLFDDRWTLQLPYPTDAWLIATEADNDFIISAGFGGLFTSLYGDIITSTDKGETWNINRSGNDTIFYTMDMEGNSIWVGGIEFESEIYNSFIIKSTDFGNNWSTKLEIDSFAVLYIEFFDGNYGVAVSEEEPFSQTKQKIFQTTNGGNSWTPIIHVLNVESQAFVFSSLNKGWLCANAMGQNNFSSIYNTTDGGLNWEIQYSDSVEGFEMIHFYDSNYGWAAGVWKDYSNFSSELRIFSTTNGGNDWTQQFAVQDDFYAIYSCDMYSLDSLNCWLAVSNWPYLKIFRTTDGGNNWTKISQLQYIDFQLGDIEFISATEGWITSAGGMIHFTSDGGYTWKLKNKSVTTDNLTSVDFVDSKTGWAITSNYYNSQNFLFKTENSGDDWSILITDTVDKLEDIDFVSRERGFLISTDHTSYPFNGSIRFTQNAGLSWNQLTFDSTYLDDITFTDENNGWIFGDKDDEPIILHTTDSGINWLSQTNISISGVGLWEGSFSDDLNGFAIGDHGAVIKTTDGGNSWDAAWGNLDPNLFWINYTLTGIYLIDSQTVWISGYSYNSGDYRRMLLHSTDSGTNWDTLSIQTLSSSGQIIFLSNNTGYSLGFRDNFKTTDGGQEWFLVDKPYSINKMFFLNERLGWAVGHSGRIFKYYDPTVGIEELTEARVPGNYLLMQNYPNPFNPSTTIKFTIPSVGAYGNTPVLLKVYDVLGNEITTLVNEEKPAGTYEVVWNAGGLPSGVYFYRLQTVPNGRQAEGFVEIKKMLLLK